MIVFIIGAYSAFAIAATSGLGSVYPEVMAAYPNDSPTRITDLMTYPTLFMGIGNLLSMPLCVAMGRRPVFICSMVLLVVSGIWCAASSSSLTSHIAGRDVFSMAAGQSEALAPMIVQDMFFLHERGSKVAWFVGVQTTGTAAFFVATVYIVPALGLGWWYGIITIINSIILVLAFFFVVESKFDRPSDASEGVVHLRLDADGNRIIARTTTTKHPLPPVDAGACTAAKHAEYDDDAVVVARDVLFRVTTAEERVLQSEKFGARTWRHDWKVFHALPDWGACASFYADTGRGLALLTTLWLMLLNGVYLGVYVYQASTFATILMAPPYLFQSGWLGFVQLVQILDCVVMVPLLGYGSDLVVRVLSRAHRGLFQPEYRLLVLAVPAVVVVLSCVLYGRAGAHPAQWSWVAVAAGYHLGFFAFLGANLVGITYSVDAFPNKAGPLLLLICAGRGFISFGLSYSTVPLTSVTGYDGAMNIYAIICGIFSGLGIAAYIFGGVVRQWAARHFWKPMDNK
jgi:hypothetical protein